MQAHYQQLLSNLKVYFDTCKFRIVLDITLAIIGIQPGAAQVLPVGTKWIFFKLLLFS